MGRIVIFGIRVNNQPKVCDESRLSRGLDDRTSEPEVCDESRLSRGLDDRTSETNLTSPGDLGLTRMQGLNGFIRDNEH